MNPSLPTAVVGGIDNFVSRKLMSVLLASDMNVVGVGSFWPLDQQEGNFLLMDNCGQIEEAVTYVFDFGAGEEVWKVAEKWEAKLTVVIINGERNGKSISKRMAELGIQGRVVELNGVYGPGMSEDGGEEINAKVLVRALREAVENKNLTLPHPMVKMRFLHIDDAVEAIMRTSFLSGVDGEVIELWGEAVEVRDLASMLMEEAKMTRFKVAQKEIEIGEVAEGIIVENRKKLRWEPKVDFKAGLKEVLQDFFVRIDEEKRRGVKRDDRKREGGNKRKVNYEVLVDEVIPQKPDTELVVEEDETEAVIEEIKTGADNEVSVWRKTREEDLEQIEAEKVKDETVIKNANIRWHSPNVADTGAGDKVKVKTEEKEPEIKEVPNKPVKAIAKPTEAKKPIGFEVKPRILKSGWLAGGGAAAVIILFIGFGWWLAIGLLTIKQAIKFEDLILKKNYAQAAEMSLAAANKLQKMDEQINEWGLNKLAVMRNYQSIIRVTGEVLRLENKSVEAIKMGEKLADGILNEGEIDWERDWKKAGEQLDEIVVGMGSIQGRLEGNWGWLPNRWKNYPAKGVKKIAEIKKTLVLVKQSWNLVPEMVGADGKRREYMVLFQNENELRAGGGFIGSWGILSFEGGKLLSLEVRDIYEADGQLKGHVEPPEPIKTYLGEAGWFMRDANWQPDFLGSAKDIQWFLDKETGRKVDGVIGVNLSTAKVVLGVVGELYIPDFKEKVNKDNLYEQAEFYSETKFFPGSNQKASFLGGLSRQLFEEVKNLNTEKKGRLVEAIIDQLEKNEIQLALNNPKSAQIVSDLGWDGAMYQGRCAEDRCFTDYLYVVESNFGVNKANYFIYRNMEQSVDISQGAIGRVLRITYENTAKSNSWPGGDYKNYMRIYLPKSSNVAEVSVLEDESKGKKVYGAGELKTAIFKDKKELAFWMVVPVGKRRVVEVRYSDQINLTTEKNFSYLHYVQKQSGFGDTGLVTLVSFPTDWQPLQVEPAANLTGGKLLFNQKLDSDIRMGVEIGK